MVATPIYALKKEMAFICIAASLSTEHLHCLSPMGKLHPTVLRVHQKSAAHQSKSLTNGSPLQQITMINQPYCTALGKTKPNHSIPSHTALTTLHNSA